ncbi:uncharacterized protein [Blastocystis hominis]|uniref:C2 domain-containing protein n=1 Tax=Blastocystis hominis TaxID=12968 RepID=D8M2S4_BLAHO|nr:uncharacterized protein [Blastocystis hominis]CBK22647.2 unnamed protein product [Blastocystis hominis]|eukprot:XP_012896695.1 uncharacterized protein [Blastocystis hominis]
MKRDNFVLVCVYSASDLNDESHYSVKVSFCGNDKWTPWSECTSRPEWHSGIYFLASFQKLKATNPITFSLYDNKGCFGKRLVATSVFDPSQLSYYEPFGQCDIDMETKSGSLFGYLSVKIQYVPSDAFFLCPSCKKLSSHSPFMLFANLQNVILKTPDSQNRDLKMILRIGNEVASTSGDPSGQLYEHFMIDYSRISSKKNLTITIYQADRDIGRIVIHMKDLLEGNVYDDSFTNEHIEKASVMLQLVYACSDCIVEKETEDGELDIPVLDVTSIPRSSVNPEPFRPSSSSSSQRIFPTPNPATQPMRNPAYDSASSLASASIELQGGPSIPGMSGFAASPSPVVYMPQLAPPRAPQYVQQYGPQPAPQIVVVPRDPRMEMAMMEPPMVVMEPPMVVMEPPRYQVVGYQESPYGSANGYVY